LLLAAPAVAQFGEAYGNLYGRVVDEQGGALPGVTVTLKGPGAPLVGTTDVRGEYRFLNIAPGRYTLTFALAGFGTVTHENVAVNLGRTQLTDTMKIGTVAAAVTVTGEAPVLDSRRVQTGAQVTQEELKSIPTARDPWVVLQSVPGVQIDRVNVAGSESGQQSTFVSKGSSMGSFSVDGVNFTDLTALGASAGYYDFDSFQEIQVITGGSDPSIQGDGAHINMITKRGTNEVHGSGRLFAVDDHFEAKNVPEEAKTQTAGIGAGNRITSVQEYGLEAGGPIVKDRLWLWGSYGRDQVNLLVAGTLTDKTTLENVNGKINWQVFSSNSADIYYQRSDKRKFGRGASSDRPQETTTDQTTPANTWKIQDSQIFSTNFFATVQYNGTDGVFTLQPEGGTNHQLFFDEGGVWHNSGYFLDSKRPQRNVKGDASIFFNTGSIGHELKAGFGYLYSIGASQFGWPGFGAGYPSDLAVQTFGSDGFHCGVPCAALTRDSFSSVEGKYYSAFIGDTLTMERLTANLGVRWDRQYGSNNPKVIPGNASFPAILPTVNFKGTSKEFTWEDFQPRVGLTYALGSQRQTILKASYARFAATLGTGTIGLTNPGGPGGYAAYAYYAWHDGTGCTAAKADHLVQPCEVDTSPAGFQFSSYFDPLNPTGSNNAIDKNLKAPRTDEVIVGIDHQVLPNLAVGVAYTYRHFDNFVYGVRYDSLTGRVLTSNDYQLDRTITSSATDPVQYSSPVYEIKQSVLDALGRTPPGFFYTNRPDYTQTFHGIDLTLVKRLSDRWMARGFFSYNNHKQTVGTAGCVDPTNVQSNAYGQSCRDDNVVATRSVGSGSHQSVYLNSKWQFNINGMYQLPLQFNAAASLLGRQGYPLNYFRRIFGDTDGLARDVEVAPTDDLRYKNVYELDMRLEKIVPITASSSLTLTADLFNVLNNNTVLQRYNRLNRSNTNQIKEVQSPRVWRFGGRFSF
jgi:hypothetical protein